MSILMYPKHGEPTGQADMRKRLRGAPKVDGAAEVWAALPIATRQSLAMRAFGIPGLEVCKKAWTDLQPHERIKIGCEARRIAGALV